VVLWSAYVHDVTTSEMEAETLGELIADCADIPRALRTPSTTPPLPRTGGPWVVTDACVEQVAGLDDYV
jgi:hypothetical protein